MNHGIVRRVMAGGVPAALSRSGGRGLCIIERLDGEIGCLLGCKCAGPWGTWAG